MKRTEEKMPFGLSKERVEQVNKIFSKAMEYAKFNCFDGEETFHVLRHFQAGFNTAIEMIKNGEIKID